MKRNTVEIFAAFLGLGMIYYGASIKTPTGTIIFVVGIIVGWVGIAPWKIYAWNYVCQLCGAEFGGGREGKLSRSSHLRLDHPDFYKWDARWNRWSSVFAVSFFVYIIGVGILVSFLPSLNAFNDWWGLGFAGVTAAFLVDFGRFAFCY